MRDIKMYFDFNHLENTAAPFFIEKNPAANQITREPLLLFDVARTLYSVIYENGFNQKTPSPYIMIQSGTVIWPIPEDVSGPAFADFLKNQEISLLFNRISDGIHDLKSPSGFSYINQGLNEAADLAARKLSIKINGLKKADLCPASEWIPKNIKMETIWPEGAHINQACNNIIKEAFKRNVHLHGEVNITLLALAKNQGMPLNPVDGLQNIKENLEERPPFRAFG